MGNRQIWQRIIIVPSQDTSRDGTISFLWYFALLRRIGGCKLFCPRRICLAQDRSIPQNPEQVSIRIQSIFFRRFNQTVDHTAGLRTARRIGEEPIFPSHHKWLYAAFSTVVAQFQMAILQVTNQVWPLLQQVMDRPAHCGFGRRFRLHLICP